MATLAWALTSICMSVAAQFAFRYGMAALKVVREGQSWTWGQTLLAVAATPAVLAGFALYGAGAALWLKVLSEWEVSKAYPLVGLGFVFSAVVGAVIGESITPARALGVLIICLGVLVIARS